MLRYQAFCIVLGFRAFCILLCFHAFCVVQDFCILLLYRATFSRFLYDAFVSCYVFMLVLYSTMMAAPCHRIPNCIIEQRFLPQILINSILVCTILWVEHNGHRRIQILFPWHRSFLCPGSRFSRIYPVSRIRCSCRGFCHVYVGIYVSNPFVCAKVYNTFESASIPFKFEVVMYLLEISILLLCARFLYPSVTVLCVIFSARI